MFNKSSHSQNILETGFATVTSGGHWFNISRTTIQESLPELLKRKDYETLVGEVVAWVDSADNITLFLYLGLVFLTGTLPALTITLLFYFLWLYYKSRFVNRFMTPILRVLGNDLIQVGVAAVALSFLGMNGNYSGLIIGVLYFFLFKVGLMRLAMNRFGGKRSGNQITLNDLVFLRLLEHYAMTYEASSFNTGKLVKQIKRNHQSRRGESK